MVLVIFMVLSVMYGGIMAALTLRVARAGRPLLALAGVLATSVVPVSLVAVAFERRSLWALLDPRSQSWAYLVGDSLLYPIAAVCAALAWRRLPAAGWARRWPFTVVGTLIGAAAGAAMWYYVDRPGYVATNTTALLLAPSKVFHDTGARPALFALLALTVIPIGAYGLAAGLRRLGLVRGKNVRPGYWAWLIPAFVLAWYVMSLHDAGRLDPTALHTADWRW